MKQTPTKLLAILLAGVMLLPTLASCSEESSTNETDTTAAGDMTTSAETTPADPLEARKTISDDLPDVNMDGYTFKSYLMDGQEKYFYAESEVGEPINDAQYRARIEISERFGAEITAVTGLADPYKQVDEIEKMVAASDSTYNMMGGHDVLLGSASLSNNFVNLLVLPYQNFDKPWWSGQESVTFMDQCYLITSDINYLGLASARVMFVNKSILSDYGLEMPYQQALDGSWTFDMLMELTKDVYEDLNADSTVDSEDLFGYVSSPACYGYLEAFDMQTLHRDGDTVSVEFDLNRMVTIVSELYAFLYESKGVRVTGIYNDFGTEDFMNNRVMIYFDSLDTAKSNLRFVEGLDYGILPMPKWDESQENYNCMIMHYPYVIPASLPTDQYENTSILLEALSAEGYKQVVPAYFEIALKQKYTTDNESMQMLDIINETKSCSFSWIYEDWKGFNDCLYKLMSQNGSDNFVSYYESNQKLANRQAEKVQKAFLKMAEAQGLR